MCGWQIPPPKTPSKSKADFARERRKKVASLIKQRLLKSERIKQALLKVPREDFIPEPYRDYAYLEVPLPLPGGAATISCPHSYPLFYEPLGLDQGHKFLEVGLGSGYGAAVAREVVGEEGRVVSIEIDPATFKYAKANLERDRGGERGDGPRGTARHLPGLSWFRRQGWHRAADLPEMQRQGPDRGHAPRARRHPPADINLCRARQPRQHHRHAI
jgi:hypothetical protein